MSYDVAFRHLQALDPSALVTVQTALHAIDTAITDCRNAGRDIETDPAILLLARHLGTVATAGHPGAIQLRRACMDAVAELKRQPALLALAHRGVAYDAPAKRAFHADGRRALRRLAEALGLEDGSFDVRANPGGVAVSGEITLHAEEVWVQLSLDCRSSGNEVVYRRVHGRRDHVGERNHWASVHDLLAPDRFAARIRRELALSPEYGRSQRLVA
jgi:hypothetical protein